MIAICLLGLAIPQTTVNSAATPTTTAANQDGWECIGRITLHRIPADFQPSASHVYLDSFLYAKAIGPKLFYQVRIQDTPRTEIYTVESCSRQIYCYGCRHKIVLDGKAGDYYIILP